MSAATDGLLDAIAGKQIRRERHGAYSATITMYGTEIEVTYDLEGYDIPATEIDPAEYATVSVVSVDFGCGPIFNNNASAWDEMLSLWERIQESRAHCGV